MKVKFMGYKVKDKKGCPVCGSGRKTTTAVRRTQVINIPNGRKMEFRAGHTYDVTDVEWEYLSEMPESFVPESI